MSGEEPGLLADLLRFQPKARGSERAPGSAAHSSEAAGGAGDPIPHRPPRA